jgi:hypothetical protein
MKKSDIFFVIVLGAIIGLLAFPVTFNLYEEATNAAPYLMGFCKFFILATMGELLAGRVARGSWAKPAGLFWRAVIWGAVGFLNVAVFSILNNGVLAGLDSGVLPGGSGRLLSAFYTSVALNISFGPTIMFMHRILDSYIDLYYERHKIWPAVSEVAVKINWENYISFVIFKTVPFVWIPAHTITFYLPAEHRVLVAAFLSMIFGALLAFAAKQKKPMYAPQ